MALYRRVLILVSNHTAFDIPKSRVVVFFFCVSWFAGLTILRGQDHLARVEALYVAAAYEEALSILDESDLDESEGVPEQDRLRYAELRVLCLLALQQSERAEAAIRTLIEQFPRYQPNRVRFSPLRREQFAAIRGRLLPQIIEAKYAEAKAALNSKDYKRAVQQLKLLLDLTEQNRNDARIADVRTFASGFLDVALAAMTEMPAGTSGAESGVHAAGLDPETRRDVRADMANQGSARTQDTAPADRTGPTIYDASASEVVPPVALSPILPPPSIADSVATPTSGLFEIVVDESGRIESISVRRSIHSQYDALVIQEGRNWRFKPATRDGRPVKFRKLIEIYAVPLAYIRR